MNHRISENHTAGVFLILLSVVTYSTKAIFVKLSYRYGVDALTLLTLRMLFSAPFFALALYLDPKTRARLSLLTLKDGAQLFTLGCLGFYVAAILDFEGLQYITASLERIVLFSYPTFVVLISAVIYRDAITKWQATALAVCYLGIVISFWSDLGREQNNTALGVVLILGCALAYASYVIGSGKLVPRLGSITVGSLALLSSTVVVTGHFLLVSPLERFRQPIEVYQYALLMAVIATVLPTFLLTTGLRRVGANVAAILSTIGPIATMTLASIFLGEEVTWLQLLGGALVIAGALLVGRKKSVPREGATSQ